LAAGSLLILGGIVLTAVTFSTGTDRSLSLPFIVPQATSSPLSTAVAKGARGVVNLRQGDSSGTGVYFAPGKVITAAHVVSGQSPIAVRFGGNSDQARDVGNASVDALDAVRDLAILSTRDLHSVGAVPLEWADVSKLQSGDQLVVVGFPLLTGMSTTFGRYSGTKRLGRVDYVQTDAAVNPGNSGGPVLDSTGNVVGVVDFKVQDSTGLNFAISSAVVVAFIGNPQPLPTVTPRPAPTATATPEPITINLAAKYQVVSSDFTGYCDTFNGRCPMSAILV
jgi:serine protease Do